MCAGGFGGGRLCQRYSVPDCPPDNEVQLNKENISNDGGLHSFARLFLAESKVFADSMVKIISMLEGAPNEFTMNPHFKRMVDAARQLVGSNVTSSEQSQRCSATQMFNQDEIDVFWNDPDCIAKLDEIEKGLMKRDSWHETFIQDHFDLGISPTRDNIIGIGREYEAMIHDEIDIDEEKRNTEMVDGGNALNEISVDGNSTYIVDQCDAQNASKCVGPNANVPNGADKVPQNNKNHPEVIVRKSISLNEAFKKRIATREVANLKLSDALLSPFRGRSIDSEQNVDKKEKELFYWLIHAKNRDMNEVVFEYKDTLLRRQEMQTLKTNVWLSTHILDVWSMMLNINEGYRSKTSPLRFFATTDVCAYTIVDAPATWTSGVTQSSFDKKFEEEIKKTGLHPLSKVDMFFFPLLKSQHYYVVCFDVKNREAWILDNSDVNDDENDARRIYGVTPFLLGNCLTNFLKTNGLVSKAECVSRAIEVMKMTWRDKQNTVDCGVYAMRHMETYMGKGLKNWKSALVKGNVAQMQRLRMKYTAAILNSPMNSRSTTIMKEARTMFGKASSKKCVTMKELLS